MLGKKTEFNTIGLQEILELSIIQASLAAHLTQRHTNGRKRKKGQLRKLPPWQGPEKSQILGQLYAALTCICKKLIPHTRKIIMTYKVCSYLFQLQNRNINI